MDKQGDRMDKLKQSRYNYRFHDGDRWIYFNGITKKFIPIPSILHELVDDYLEDPLKVEHESPAFLSSMLDAGLLIRTEQDELEIIREQYSELRNDASYQLLLSLDGGFFPSLNHMHDKDHSLMISSLKRHIERYIKENDIKKLELELIEKFQHPSKYEAIRELSTLVFHICQKEGISLSLHLNLREGLFDEQLLDLLRTIPVQSLRMPLEDDPMQDNVQRQDYVHRVQFILDHFPSLFFVFFVQETQDGTFLNSWLPVFNDVIPKSERQRISFFVHDAVGLSEQHNVYRAEVMFQLNQEGYNMHWNSVLPSLCMAEKRHAFSMNGSGDVAKCLWTLDRVANGYLSTHGNIFWDETTVRAENEIPFFENIRCLSCKHLPVCMGQCIPIERKNQNTAENSVECLLPPWYISPEKVIELYCKQRLDRYLNEGNMIE